MEQVKMQIHFYPQEKELMRKYAETYRKRTGDNYSVFYIMSLLSTKYERDLEKDLKEIMKQKVREFEENRAEEGVKL